MKKITVKCEYCDNILKFSHFENKKEIIVFDCQFCPFLISFYFWNEEGGSLTKITFMIIKNGQFYIWTNNFIKQNSYISIISTDNTTLMSSEPLITFPKIMDITPANIDKKLSFVMTWI